MNFGEALQTGTQVTFAVYVDGPGADKSIKLSFESTLMDPTTTWTQRDITCNTWHQITLECTADNVTSAWIYFEVAARDSSLRLDGTSVKAIYLDNVSRGVISYETGIGFENIIEQNVISTPYTYASGEGITMKRVKYADTDIASLAPENTYGAYGMQGVSTQSAQGYPSFRMDLDRIYVAGSTITFDIYIDAPNTYGVPPIDIFEIYKDGTPSAMNRTASRITYNKWGTVQITFNNMADALKVMVECKNPNGGSNLLGDKIKAIYVDNIKIVEPISLATTEVTAGQKLYFGAVIKDEVLNSIIYDANGTKLGKVSAEDMREVESFGGAYSIYCYTVPEGVKYVDIAEEIRSTYYTTMLKDAADTTSDEAIIDAFIEIFGVPKPSEETVAALQGKSALFVGDSITNGHSDFDCIYGAKSWAGRIGYYCGMDVTNNGQSGSCIGYNPVVVNKFPSYTNRYVYNQLVEGIEASDYDYIIMHGLYNDAPNNTPLGTPVGRENFEQAYLNGEIIEKEPNFATALELLFYTAKTKQPNATLGFIVNFETKTSKNISQYAAMAMQICEDWDVEYLDLYTGATPGVLADGTVIELPDDLHPSSKGYDSFYTKIADWMARLGKEE